MKKESYIKIVIVVIILLLWVFLIQNNNNNKENKNNNFNFIKYPEEEINFAWEKMLTGNKYLENQERFDKNFLISAHNVYQVLLYKKRASKYFPYIEQKLKENNIPDDFKYLAVAESALRNDALSVTDAWWIWQFMPATARNYGLTVNENLIDERYNFEKATDSAIKYIKKLYSKFWNRTLVAAAYNRGEWGLQKALDNQWVDNYYDLRINSETADYIFRIMWIKYAMLWLDEDNSEINKIAWEDFKNHEYNIITVEKIDNISNFCKQNKISQRDFYRANPWVIWTYIPDIWKTWEIKIIK